MGESAGEWGSLAEHDDELAAQWDGFARLPEPGENDALDAFCASKHIDIPSLVRIGAKLADPLVLAFALPGGIKFRNIETGRRWNALGSEFTTLKVVRAAREPSSKVIIAEGETDAARLSLLYDCDVAVLPAGARRFTASFADQLRSYEQVLIGLDNDAAGEAGAALIQEFLPHSQRFAPPDCNDWCALDPNDGAPPLPAPEDNPLRVGPFTFIDLGPAYRGELPPPEVIVDDMLYDQGIHLFSGHPGSGKSILAMAMADFMLAEQRHVAWLDWEMGERATGQRLREMDVEISGVLERFHYAWCPKDPENHLAVLAEHYDRPLIVFDSLSKALRQSGIDENSPGEVTAWTMKVIQVCKAYRLPLIIIDHVSKNAKDKRYSRGAGSKLADVDVHWHIDVLQEFDRSTQGIVRLLRAKDREGYMPQQNFFTIGDGHGRLPVVPTDDPQIGKDDEPSI